MSSRKNRSPEEQARRAKIRDFLQESSVSSMGDIQNLFKDTIAEFMENGLDTELDEELGYSKYDYSNKDTDNSRNGHSVSVGSFQPNFVGSNEPIFVGKLRTNFQFRNANNPVTFLLD